jgi:hypothetical protein
VIEDANTSHWHIDSDEALAGSNCEKLRTVFDQCGICRIGSDPDRSVVDARLPDHGFDGQRIAYDAKFFSEPRLLRRSRIVFHFLRTTDSVFLLKALLLRVTGP